MVRSLTFVLLLAALGTHAASAKEGAQAHLLRPLPKHAQVGSLVIVRWSVDVPGTRGTRLPFGAIGMFVRLIGSNGASTSATAQGGPPYEVRVRVPEGGLRSLRFGLMGTACGPSGCRPSPIFFPLR